MTILLDAMGGDNAPDEAIKGAVKAAKEIKSDIILVLKLKNFITRVKLKKYVVI